MNWMGFQKLKLIYQNTLISCNKNGSSNTSTSLRILISCQDTWRPSTERRTMSVAMTSTVTPTLAADRDKHTLYWTFVFRWYSVWMIFLWENKKLILQSISHCDAGNFICCHESRVTVTSCFDTNGQLMLYH